MKTIRILLSDDHASVRAGIRSLLETQPDFEVAGEAACGVETINLVNQLSPDVLLLDMKLPELNGVEVAHRLCAARSPVKILGFSM